MSKVEQRRRKNMLKKRNKTKMNSTNTFFMCFSSGSMDDTERLLLGIQYLFLVGGFAESPILQYEIRRAFSSILKVIIPQDVSLTILKGHRLSCVVVTKKSNDSSFTLFSRRCSIRT
jgi:hypothetical protein